MLDQSKPKVAVSSCLLGHNVRFDGGHKNNPFIADTLTQHVDFVHYCPEVAIGLGTPRPTIHLHRQTDDSIIVKKSNRKAETDSRTDLEVTDALSAYARQTTTQLADVSGYIFKKGSPTCGVHRVRVYRDSTEVPTYDGRGVFAAKIMELLPNLPVEEEGRLQDPGLRDNFIERVYLYSRWLALIAGPVSRQSVIAFHTQHKFALLAHNEAIYRELGRMVAAIGDAPLEDFLESYIRQLMEGMSTLATPGKHANVLMHIMGFFKDELSAEDKQELLQLIEDHKQGLVPVIVPITLINHFRRKYPNAYIDEQSYLEPHPRELMLRNSM